jgi:hypothetical protein
MFGASKQAAAAEKAAKIQMEMFKQTREDLLPYNQSGQGALNMLMGDIGYYTAPVKMTRNELVNTPGYQWNLQQGLKSVQNSAAARGLGNSGAALKGAASYATGLADSTYRNQFDMETANRTNAYNRLLGIATLGQNAAAQTGAQSTQAAANIGGSLIGQGNAQAAGYLGAAGALNNGVQNYLGYNYMNNLTSRGGMYGNQYAFPPAPPTPGGGLF